jgi:hypothetical protein
MNKTGMLWLFVVLAALFFCSNWARGDDHSFKYGMGLINGERTGTIKAFSLRQESHLIYAAHTATEVGLWTDTGRAQGRKGSAFAKGQLGVKPGWTSIGLYGKAFWGLQLQSSVDSQLGGIAQFSQDFGIGIRDESCFVGVNYTHVSSAGIWKPNKGRDFMGLEMGITF